MNCYCQSGKKFEICCKPIVSKIKYATSPEELMRSRYTAFVLKNFDHLIATHDPKTRTDFDLQSNKNWANIVQFNGLEVIETKIAKVDTAGIPLEGTVKFKAHFIDIQTGRQFVHHELSQFRKEGQMWYFVSGVNPR